MVLSYSQELFPANKRSCEHFSKYFTDAGLKELSDFARNQQSIGARKELQKELQDMMSRGEPQREVGVCVGRQRVESEIQQNELTGVFCVQIIAFTKEEMKKANLSEQTMIGIIWTSVMSCVEWNKKEELVTEQAIKHLKVPKPHLQLCLRLFG